MPVKGLRLVSLTTKYLLIKIWLVAAIISGIIGQCLAWTGTVVGVSDGDTITVLTDSKEEVKVRLYGVDCPEKRQDFGTKAKQFPSEKVFGKRVDVDPVTIDKYGRTIGIVNVNGANLSHLLIESGMAWVYDQYCKMEQCENWKKTQERARAKKAGVWSMKDPKPPWEFRHSDKYTSHPEEVKSFRSENSYGEGSAYTPSDTGNWSGGGSSGSSGGKVWVNSYQRRDGTSVRGHYRSK